MVKVRMNTADVAAEVKCLRRLIGMRCSNVYDLSPKTYMFKLMKSSGVTESGESEKVLLLMESGARFHTTAYVRDKSTTPSGFTLKLRKHIRSKRLEDVRQLGYDRIILFQFGLGAGAHYVILELYAQGNILLTDSDFLVMTLLRSHRDDDKGLAIMSRHRYPVEASRAFQRVTISKIQIALASASEPETDTSKGNGDHVKGKKLTLKSVLGEALGYGPTLAEHIILEACLNPHMKLGDESKLNITDETIQVLAAAIAKFEDWLSDIIYGEKIPEGYILIQDKISGKKEKLSLAKEKSGQAYEDYCPILLNQFKSKELVGFETFDSALDEFYSKIESQRTEQQLLAKEESAAQRLNKIRVDQENRVNTLRKEVDLSTTMAELIEYNLDDVDAAIVAVRVALANGMDWEDLARMIKEEKKSGNPVAGLIDKLHLERNCITLLLSNNLDDMDDDEKTCPVQKVEVDLALSAHANARRWYDLKKRQENKQEKTITAHEKAFKAAEKKTRLQLSQEKVVAAITHMRKVHWFEKFNWFISSENYLVISGRDAQQNEMIVKRYMAKGDIYVHAELHGASSTVIKNHKIEDPIPPLTLNQAGCFTVCHSQAWDSKIVTSAWWVYPHQVSKTAPTGEYLTVGSFMIRGKKNFLPPHPLVMGFGLLFRLDESSLGSHLNERRIRGEDDGTLDLVEEVSGGQADPAEKQTSAYSLNEGESLSGISGEESGHQYNSTKDPKPDDPNDLAEDRPDSSTINTSKMVSSLEDLIDRALEIGSSKLTDENSDYNKLSMTSEENREPEVVSFRDKPYISKAERRKQKKGQKDGSDNSPTKHDKDANVNKPTNKQSDNNVDKVKPSGGKIARGQKGKLKRIKEKYGKQDDEERKIRMALLASAGKELLSEDSAHDKTAASDESMKPLSGPDDSLKVCYRCKKVGHLSRDCQEHLDGQNLDRTVESDNVALEEDDINEIAEEEKLKLNDIDYLTGNPLPNDILHYAVPICGPYNALQTYKYRVKITPGTAKKGKAAKTAMNLFSHMSEASGREKELMKACSDPELVAAIIGNVKITAAGLTQLKQKQKKGKKSGREGSGKNSFVNQL